MCQVAAMNVFKRRPAHTQCDMLSIDDDTMYTAIHVLLIIMMINEV